LRARSRRGLNFVQLAAPRRTEWTARATARNVARMTTKRSQYDPLATSTRSRWLVLRDLFHNVLDSTELPAGTDLRQAFADGLAALERDGWRSEGASGGMVFVQRGAERRFFALHEVDPHEPAPMGHGVLASGRCATCE
jgi:hypothetical protein